MAGSGYDLMCFPVSKRTQNKDCCAKYGGGNCPPTAALPATDSPGTITPSPTPEDNANLVFTQSAYGGVIPIVFGSDLISGNVIWATPFIKRTFMDGDKQKYYYSVSLAIALCEGEIDHLLRIKVGDTLVLDNITGTNPDGTPVRDVNGAVSSLTVDLTTPDSPLTVLAPGQRQTKITIYSGAHSQTPPAVMIAQEGYEYTPAYRGTAYLLIENWLVIDSVPSLSVEISANTESLYPRLVGSMSTDPAITDYETRGIMYLPGYNVYATGAITAGGSRNTGFTFFDGNTLELQKSTFIPSVPGSSFAQRYDYAFMLTSGNILAVNNITRDISFVVWSPFSDTIISQTGQSGVNGVHVDGGPQGSYDDAVRIVRGIDMDGELCDIVFTMSFPLSNNPCLSIFTITDEGKIKYTFFTNGADARLRGWTALWGGGVTSAVVAIPQTVADITPTFPDDDHITFGPHVFYFSRTNTTPDLYVDRLDFDSQADGTVSLANPRMVPYDIIPAADLFGTYVYPRKAMFCKSDMSVVVVADVVGLSTQITTVFFKYDILNKRIVWKTPFYDNLSSIGVNNSGYFDRGVVDDISNEKWAWIGRASRDAVWSIEFKTGIIKKEFLTAEQGILPQTNTPSFLSSRYNGREDSIIIWGRSLGAAIYKVFLSRTNRAQVPLSTIIKKLLARVDWREADISIQGFDTLAVDGYTISNDGYTLRQAFNELQQVFTFDIVESNGEIAYKQRGNLPVATVYETKLQAGDTGVPWLTETHEYDMAGTRKLSVSYRDVDRDYKTNVQSVVLPKYDESIVDADAAISVQVPIVLQAETARKLAEILLYAKITYQAGYTGALPSSAMPYDPSDVVTFKFNPADNLDDITIRLRQTSIGADYSYQFTAAREDPDIYTDQINLFGTLGRYTPPSIPEPPARVDFLPLAFPFTSDAQAQANDALPDAYPIYTALISLKFGGSKIPADDITLTTEAGNVYQMPKVQNFPTWGFVIGNPVPNHVECYTTGFSESFTVRIMSADGATLGSCTDYYDMLNNRTKNLAWVGNELIQFQTATDNGDGTWTFSILRHALFGTEDGAMSHVAGEKFILLGGSDGLINTRSFSQTNVELGDGENKQILIGMPTSKNLEQPDLSTTYTSKQFRPYRPSAAQINYSGNDAVLSWKRRSRYNGQWPDDGSEAASVPFTDGSPLISVPTFDLYLTRTPATFNPADVSTYFRKTTIGNASSFTYTAAMQTADGFDRTTETLVAVVYQTVNVTGLDSSLGLVFSRGPLA